jgi:apolipoprotein N-acyltransferase
MVVATTSGISGVISASGAVSNRFSGEGGNVFVAKVGLGSGKAFTDINPANRYRFLGVLFVLLLSRRLRSRAKGNAVDGASE